MFIDFYYTILNNTNSVRDFVVISIYYLRKQKVQLIIAQEY